MSATHIVPKRVYYLIFAALMVFTAITVAVAFVDLGPFNAVVALGIAGVTEDTVNVALPLAGGFWLIGLLLALWAAFPTLRYWEGLPETTRWLGALPLLSVSLFFTAALIAALFM